MTLLALTGGPAAHAYTFGEPGVRQTSPEVPVFDWSAQKCENNDIPDQAAKAYRDASGQVVLIDTHFTVRRYVGPSLANVAHSCSVVMSSHNNADPSLFNEKEWLGATWTEDGNTVHGLVHSEYQGYNHGPGYCIRSGESFEDKQKCWYNTFTLTKSVNGGATFTHATPPNHFVAGPSYPYAAGIGPIGYFQPSNIVRGKDGYLYVLAHVENYGAQPFGSCPMRTNDIDDPRSWRLWDGGGFNRSSADPYRTPGLNPANHVCQPVSPHIGTISESLTWSTYFKKWLLVGAWQGPGPGPAFADSGFYYYTSDDLVNWSPAKLLMNGRLPWTFRRCTDSEQIRDPSVLDPESESRNFDSTGQRPFIYFTRFHINSSCNTSLDRDLIRIPIEFTNRQPGGPQINTLTASDPTPQPGDTVNFTASAADTDGRITAYKWDLDGDGSYEHDSGTNPVATKTYTAHEKLTVTVRACDNDRKATDETMVVNVGSAPLAEPPAQAGSNATGGVCPVPDNTAPETTIGTKPAATSTDPTATFTFSANEQASFACSLDGGPAEPCTSPREYTSLADGAHTFEVRATDQAGNPDPTPATHSWRVDTTAPETTIGTKPAATSTDRTATFTFSANEPGSFSCSLDGAPAQPCSAPRDYTSLADGQHTFSVRATDQAGNSDPTPATHSWRVDATAPETTIAAKPDAVMTEDTATFTFSANEQASFACSLDGGPAEPCTSPREYTSVADGQHTFEVRATDLAGNPDPTPATHTWTVDTTPPQTTIGTKPDATTTDTGARFTFSANEPATFSCSLDGGPAEPCTSPREYTNLADGPHTFEVSATDLAGNTEPSPTTHSWTSGIDITAPETTIESGPPAATTDTTATFAFSASEQATFMCSLDGGAPEPCDTPQDYTNLPLGPHTFDVFATDPSLNSDPTPAHHAWTVEDNPPPAPAGDPAPAPALRVPVASGPASKLARMSIVGKPKARADGSMLLKVRLPGAGRLVVRARGPRAAIRPARRRATKAGTINVAVRPSTAGLEQLRRKRAVKVRTTLVFTPLSGTAHRSIRTLTLKRAPAR